MARISSKPVAKTIAVTVSRVGMGVTPLLAAPTPLAFFAALSGATLAAISDLRTRRVPDLVVLPAIGLSLSIRIVAEGAIWWSLPAPLAGSLVVLAARVLTRGGIGWGDVKLAALPAAALGAGGGLMALLVAALIALGRLAIARLIGRRREAIAFAPCVALGLAATGALLSAIG